MLFYLFLWVWYDGVIQNFFLSICHHVEFQTEIQQRCNLHNTETWHIEETGSMDWCVLLYHWHIVKVTGNCILNWDNTCYPLCVDLLWDSQTLMFVPVVSLYNVRQTDSLECSAFLIDFKACSFGAANTEWTRSSSVASLQHELFDQHVNS